MWNVIQHLSKYNIFINHCNKLSNWSACTFMIPQWHFFSRIWGRTYAITSSIRFPQYASLQPLPAPAIVFINMCLTKMSLVYNSYNSMMTNVAYTHHFHFASIIAGHFLKQSWIDIMLLSLNIWSFWKVKQRVRSVPKSTTNKWKITLKSF